MSLFRSIADTIRSVSDLARRARLIRVARADGLTIATDAPYVAPTAEGPSAVNEAEIEVARLFGSYARALGWSRGKPGGTENDPTFRLRDAA
jgi:hypothetical protein